MDLTDVRAISALKLLLAAFICWQEHRATDCVFFFSLTCSVHHHHFGVFLPQEGTVIGALLAELSLPQP